MRLLLLLLSLSFSINAQECGTPEYMDKLKIAEPDFKHKYNMMESELQNYIQGIKLRGEFNSNDILEIPCVVHVVHDTSYPEVNICDEQIYEQMDILNRDFRKLNTDIDSIPYFFQHLTADMKMEFCLKEITRTETDRHSFSYWDDAVKSDYMGGKSPWDTKQYLNIWICNLSWDLLGYAQFPGLGPDSTDGVVIDYTTVAEDRDEWDLDSIYSGRVLQHEVGHWLNLRHIWGDHGCDGTDHVDDTPNQGSLYRDCHQDTISCDSRDLVMNYMDYVQCSCMRCFTKGQKMRAWGSMALFRRDILDNTCDENPNNTRKIDKNLDVKIYPTFTARFINIKISNLGCEEVEIIIFNHIGRIVKTAKTTKSIDRINLSGLNNGVYHVLIRYKNKRYIQQITLNKFSIYGGERKYNQNYEKH
jgi:hypothetical protein